MEDHQARAEERQDEHVDPVPPEDVDAGEGVEVTEEQARGLVADDGRCARHVDADVRRALAQVVRREQVPGIAEHDCDQHEDDAKEPVQLAGLLVRAREVDAAHVQEDRSNHDVRRPVVHPADNESERDLVHDHEIPFGFIVRGMHHWAAHIMIAAVFLHMCRVYFTGAYKKPRELNWLLGVILMLITIMFGYSGYLLPANNLSEGAANIGINMTRASPVIGDQPARLLFRDLNTLTGVYILRWYWIHVFILPLLGTGLMILHMGLVWLQGVAEPH